MKNRILGSLTALLLCLFPFGVSGCKSDTLKINEVTHSVFYAPMYLADALGYYEEQGFSVSFTNGGGADNTMAALLSGEADVGFCGPEAAIYVALGGSSDTPKVFGQLTKRDGSFLVARTAENFSWKNLEGKEILAGRRGGVPAMTFEYTLKEAGVTAKLNYDVAFNMMTSAFERGIADYCTMFEPAASEYEKAGKGKIVASVGEKSGEIPYTCFMAKQSFLDKNEKKVKGFLAAITKAIDYTFQTDDKTIADLLAPYFDGTSLESLQTSVRNYKRIDSWVTNMAMKPEAWSRLQDVISEAGELKARVPFEQVVLTKWANEAYQNYYDTV